MTVRTQRNPSSGRQQRFHRRTAEPQVLGRQGTHADTRPGRPHQSGLVITQVDRIHQRQPLVDDAMFRQQRHRRAPILRDAGGLLPGGRRDMQMQPHPMTAGMGGDGFDLIERHRGKTVRRHPKPRLIRGTILRQELMQLFDLAQVAIDRAAVGSSRCRAGRRCKVAPRPRPLE